MEGQSNDFSCDFITHEQFSPFVSIFIILRVKWQEECIFEVKCKGLFTLSEMESKKEKDQGRLKKIKNKRKLSFSLSVNRPIRYQ